MLNNILCFALPVPNTGLNNVVLVKQQGRLNLPGGSIEPGETFEEAAVRRLREETGIAASLADTKYLGRIRGLGWTSHVCHVPYRPFQEKLTGTAEGNILELPWREVMNDARLIPNLRVIIPLCMARCSEWVLEASDNENIWRILI